MLNACVSEEKKRMKDPKELNKSKDRWFSEHPLYGRHTLPTVDARTRARAVNHLSRSICNTRLYYKIHPVGKHDCGNGFRTRVNVKPIGAGYYQKWRPTGPMIGCAKYCECSFSSETQGVPINIIRIKIVIIVVNMTPSQKHSHRMGRKNQCQRSFL